MSSAEYPPSNGITPARRTVYMLVKRGLDLVVASAALVLSAPLLILCAVAVKLDSQGPVLFRQTRIGLRGRPFTILKLRSMIADRPHARLKITAQGDARVTRVGRLLRSLKLDELPQLVNVLRGEMSLVGPRPEIAEYVATYSLEQSRVLDVRPGITGPSSLHYIDEEELLAGEREPEQFYRQHLLPRKLELDLAYCAKATLIKNIRILIRTC